MRLVDMTPIKGLAKQGLFALQQFDMTPLKGLAKQATSEI
jgi:hypothetical protein